VLVRGEAGDLALGADAVGDCSEERCG